MGRHRAPEIDLDDQDRTVPILRMPQVRPAPMPMPMPMPMPKMERQVPGLLFPIVDDLSMIAADDQMLDSIAAGRSDFGDLFAGAPALVSGNPYPSRALSGVLEPLLVTWRCDVIEAPLPATPVLPAPVRVMRAPSDRPARRAIKPMIAAAAAISALLLGSTAVGARSARPGDTLWPLAQVLYSGHAHSVVALQHADDSLNSAVLLLKRGDAPKALIVLTSASGQVEQVELGRERENLQTRLDILWVKAQNETQAAASSAGAESAAGVHPSPVDAARTPGSSGPVVLPTPTSASISARRTSVGNTTGPTTPISRRPGDPTVPVVVVAPTTRRTTPAGGVPTTPIAVPPPTTPPRQSSPPVVVPPPTVPAVTPTPPTVPATTPTTPAPVTSPPDTPTPTATPTPSSEPAVSDDPTTPTDLSTTSELPTPTAADTPTDDPQANVPAAAPVTDASQ